MYTEKVVTVTEEMDSTIKLEIDRVINMMMEGEGMMQFFYSAILVGITTTLKTLGLEEYEAYVESLAQKENEIQEQAEGEVQEQLGIDSSEAA